MTKKQKREYYMAVIKSNLGWRFKDFKGMTFEEIEAKFAEVWKQVEDFIPMGSKEETEKLKRKGLNLEKEQVKKQKSSEEAPDIETSTEEITKEKMKKMMEDLNQLWALVKEYLSIRPATKWKLYDLGGVHHVTAKDKEIFMLVEKDYPLKRGLALVMISYKLQVENNSQMAEDLIRKIYNIANTPSGSIPTAGPPATIISTGSEVGPTASPVVIRRKRKEVLVESDTPKKKKLQEQIDAQVARELEEQQEK
nr:hypothetical protein [Tanacetum cinerariifolium]